jgi:8-oxo-dGTP pyrophosphatase MutT (NUDIX family)
MLSCLKGISVISMAMSRPLVSLLKSRLALNPPEPAATPGLVPAAVLAPLFFKEGEEAHLLFTQRTLTLKDHRGQISFPGGVRTPDDPDLLTTALRETREEIGLDPRVVELLGALAAVATMTGYRITPFLGLIPHPYEFHPNPQEVERLLLLPLEGFFDPARWSSRTYHYQGRNTRVCDWRGDGELIWGATARILLNLLALLDQHPIPGDRHATCLD